MNIGLSFGITSSEFSIWSDSSTQSIFHLYFLLKNISEYNVYIVNFGNPINEINTDIQEILKNINIVEYDDVKNNLDVFIEIGVKITNETTKELKDNGTKVILFNVENTAIKDIEDILFRKNNDIIPFDNYDEIWMFQHHEKLNKQYLETLYKKNVYTLPLIWSDVFINHFDSLLFKQNLNLKYEDKNDKKDVTIFENNISVSRNSIYNFLIAEKAYTKRPELFNKFRFLNTYQFKDNVKFLSFVNSLNIKKDGVATFENRYSTPYILSKYTDIVLTHQWENELSYLFFDVLYGNYPMIHNSNFLDFDIYKYNDFNIELASDKLINAAKNHKLNIKKYNTYVFQKLIRFSVNNNDNIQKYKEKIDEIIKK
jgi:hypothetical protein